MCQAPPLPQAAQKQLTAAPDTTEPSMRRTCDRIWGAGFGIQDCVRPKTAVVGKAAIAQLAGVWIQHIASSDSGAQTP